MQHLHVVCLENPYPPNYGGAIEQHYKIQAFLKAQVPIVLHILYSPQRPPAPQVYMKAQNVYFYPRNKSLRALLGKQPFMVRSRKNSLLIKQLMQDTEPILLEGIHTSAILNEIKNIHPERKIFLRLHNHEALYYQELAKNETHILKKFYYFLEAIKLQFYEPYVLQKVDAIFAISTLEAQWCKQYNPNTYWLPAFFYDSSNPIASIEQPILYSNSSDFYILYPANFAIPTNRAVAKYLIKSILPVLKPHQKLILAGNSIPKNWLLLKHPQLFCYSCPENMQDLIQKASIILLPGKQRAGIKIKFLESVLYHPLVAASSSLVKGSGLEPWSLTFENHKIREFLENILNTPIEVWISKSRVLKEQLLKLYNPSKQVEFMLSIIGH
ncbi:MAG: hypothetical protein RML72_11100 [Bacteroidia bacterium]|nr:hypothetical protein [Bacteroidia bacterium]MDW8159404.1 hypothetical protein [Bacteroidia bacterium]